MVSIIAIGLGCSLLVGTTVNAEETKTLDEIINSETVVEESINNQENQETNDNVENWFGEVLENEVTGDLIEEAKGSVDYSNSSDKIAPVTNGIQKAAGIIVNVLTILICSFLGISILIDLAYICLPFSRKFLNREDFGSSQMNSSYNNSFGGFGSGVQSSTYSSSESKGKLKLVSNAAIRAVEAENTKTQDGKHKGALFPYVKSMAVIMIIIPVLVVLAVTGVLMQLGFMIGGVITGMLGGIGK